MTRVRKFLHLQSKQICVAHLDRTYVTGETWFDFVSPDGTTASGGYFYVSTVEGSSGFLEIVDDGSN